MTAYYNELDPYAAQWLRNLISAGEIAPGVVDERSILDVKPDDLAGFTQCHFFAGVGVWSAALRRAGWDDSRPVWTGSCPCQPFSAAGNGGGFDDERHLWPAWAHLIGERKPSVVFGEQVASRDGYAWLDLVQSDLEGLGYACGAVVSPAAGFGAPHGRHRQWFVASRGVALGDPCHSGSQGYWQSRNVHVSTGWSVEGRYSSEAGVVNVVADASEQRHEWAVLARRRGNGPSDSGATSVVAFPDSRQRDRITDGEGREPDRQEAGWIEGDGCAAERSEDGGMADASMRRRQQLAYAGPSSLWRSADGSQERLQQPRADSASISRLAFPGRPGPVNGHWRNADWLYCRDGKWRPVESGTFPLAHGATSRVGRLRAYGNAIVLEAAAGFITAAMAALEQPVIDERAAA